MTLNRLLNRALRVLIACASVSVGLVAPVAAGPRPMELSVPALMATPVLNTNNIGYCLTSSPTYTAYVTGADPNSQVTFDEYQFVGGSTWVRIWHDTSGSTDSSGAWSYNSSPPDRVGEFYAEVTVNNQVSNRVWYWVGNC